MERLALDDFVLHNGARGRVVEVSDDGSTGFVEFPTDPSIERRRGRPTTRRVYFHASELELDPNPPQETP